MVLRMPVTLRWWVDRTSIKPDASTNVRLVVELEATGDAVERERPASTTMLAIDVSGSMAGAPLDHVIRSVDLILDALRPIDRLGVVAFADGASHVVGPVAVDASGKQLVKSRVGRLHAQGNTNVEAGIEAAAGHIKDADRRCVVLLSDGVPNRGATTVEALREAIGKHRPHVTVSALGYGIEHSEDILSAVGAAGGGGYEFVPDPAACARSFAKALGAQADVVASGVELVIDPAHGVDVVKLLGREESRFGKNGLTVPLPDMVPGAKRVVAIELAVSAPGSMRFLQTLATLRLRARSPSDGRSHEHVDDASIEVAARDAQPVAEALSRLALVRADVVRADARALADRGNFAGAGAALRGLLDEITKVPGFRQGDGSALAEAYELVLDEAMAMERRPSAEAYKQFRKTQMTAHLSAPAAPASSRGAMSTRFLEQTAGNYPLAMVVVIDGPRAGEKHRLKEENVIGRSASADIAITSDSISRRHADIYALEGAFWASDMGSTNTTLVNGQRLGSAPVQLTHGDVIQVGQVKLRYEELKKLH